MSSGILASLIRGGDLTQWGLVNAVTQTAHEVVTDYDRSTELEKIGGELLTWSAAQINTLAA
jgi:hypothetical protein